MPWEINTCLWQNEQTWALKLRQAVEKVVRKLTFSPVFYDIMGKTGENGKIAPCRKKLGKACIECNDMV